MAHPPKREIAGLYALMERYIDGDRSAFTALHRRMEPRLRSFLMKLVQDETASDDLLQLTLLKAHLARARFHLPGGDPDGAVQGWYFAIARNVAMDFLRDRYRTGKRTAASSSSQDIDAVMELPDKAPNVEEIGEQAERDLTIVEQVRAAIALLPPGQREVVELHKLQGMSMAAIAERLAVREGAIRVRAHRAYKALARLLEPKALQTLLVLIASESLASESLASESLAWLVQGG